MKFTNYDELTSHISDMVVAALPDREDFEVSQGYSNQSCSAYVNVLFLEADDDGDYLDYFGSCKVRLSDHADRHGSDLSIEFKTALDSDDIGDVDLADWRIAEMVAEAVEFINQQYEAQK